MKYPIRYLLVAYFSPIRRFAKRTGVWLYISGILQHIFGANLLSCRCFIFVIYYGTEEKWDGAVCLYDMLNIDKELEPYVTNYKLNLFDYHECEDFSVFKTENERDMYMERLNS